MQPKLEHLEALNPLVYEDFAPYVSQAFTLTQFAEEALNLPLVLIEATHRGSSSIPGYRDNFSLLFKAPASHVMYQQGMCTLQHPAKGSVTLFLVSNGQDTEACYYQAIFN